MASALTEKVKERRSRVLLGPLPPDFLRINASIQQQQEAADRQAALALAHQLSGGGGGTGTAAGGAHNYTSAVGRLSITVVQAKLARNYGLTRMDPYARIRVGHVVYETPTDPNGSKNPRWNKVLHCLLPQGINTITIEIFDERSFTMDELIAWTQITIPQQVLAGETHEEWYPLNGKQGEGVEGMINLVLSYVAFPSYSYRVPVPAGPPVMIVPNVGGCSSIKPLNVYTAPPPATNPDHVAQPQQQAQPAPIVIDQAEIKQIEEMFPNIDKEVIKTVFEANRGNKDATVNSLLQLAE